MQQPDWSKAPADATHFFASHEGTSSHWRKRAPDGQWQETDGMTHRWYPPYSAAQRRDTRRITPRPTTDYPEGASHYRAGGGAFYCRGPNYHARMWSAYNGEPAWVVASSVKNTDLDDPERFTPLTPITQPETTATEHYTMSAEEAKSLALDARPMKVVEVRFQRAEGAKTYHYYAPQDAKSGDFAIVYANDNIVSGREFPFTVVEIINDEVVDTQRATKAILGTFNEGFAKHVQARIEHMARVKSKLQQKKKLFEESAFFEMLAQSDPEAAALLEELKAFRM